MHMNGFERRARQIKDKIKETTLKMLSVSSVKEIRVADIAAEAGVSQVTIYNYFGSKEALIREIFLEFIESILDEFEAFVTGDATLKEKIECIILQKKKISHSFHPSVLAELMENDPEVRFMIQKNYEERSLPLVVELLTKSKANGEISNHISIDTVMLYLSMLNESSHRMLESIQYEKDQEKLIEEMVNVFFYGICGSQTQK